MFLMPFLRFLVCWGPCHVETTQKNKYSCCTDRGKQEFGNTFVHCMPLQRPLQWGALSMGSDASTAPWTTCWCERDALPSFVRASSFHQKKKWPHNFPLEFHLYPLDHFPFPFKHSGMGVSSRSWWFPSLECACLWAARTATSQEVTFTLEWPSLV